MKNLILSIRLRGVCNRFFSTRFSPSCTGDESLFKDKEILSVVGSSSSPGDCGAPAAPPICLASCDKTPGIVYGSLRETGGASVEKVVSKFFGFTDQFLATCFCRRT